MPKAGCGNQISITDVTDLTLKEFVQRLAQAPLAYQPGTVWEYSLAIDLLGRVVEKASGQRLGDFLAERLFKPLGMTDSGFWVPSEKLSRVAQPLATDPATAKPISSNRRIAAAEGGLWRGGRRFDGRRLSALLSNASERREAGQCPGSQSDHRGADDLDQLDPDIRRAVSPGELLMGVQGYTLGWDLWFASRAVFRRFLDRRESSCGLAMQARSSGSSPRSSLWR